MLRDMCCDVFVSRRSFLQYIGYGTAAAIASGWLSPFQSNAGTTPSVESWIGPDGVPRFASVRYPLPLPTDPPDSVPVNQRLAQYDVVDDLILPDGWGYEVLAKWGDRFGPIVFGTSSDYTGLLPIRNRPNEYFLIVNHEYISARPWLQGVEDVHGQAIVDEQGCIAGHRLLGLEVDLLHNHDLDPDLKKGIQNLCARALSDLGLSVLHVRRRPDGGFEVVDDSTLHFRVHGFGGQNFDPRMMSFTGSAAPWLGRPRGTFSNCSGATTPWGTFLSCEENFQDQVPEFITPSGTPLPDDSKWFRGIGQDHPTGLPYEFEGLGTGLDDPLDGRQFGWVVEVDPVRKTLRKHTCLGRFRHENVALRVESGKPLVAYMGDDRRGGHVWKFVSEEPVQDPTSAQNTRLLERGTLYAARFRPDFTGEWVALTPQTPLSRPRPEQTSGNLLWLPYRPQGGHVAVGIGKSSQMSLRRWISQIEMFTGKPLDQSNLGDLCDPGLDVTAKQGVILMDAYVMANAAGATPTARPEDIEVHPVDQSVYIAFTDSTGSGDGYPDVSIFPDSQGENSRQYGAIYRLVETDNQPHAMTFTWGRFVASGEVYEQGSGFACADNLVFDPNANLWMVCDISTPRHNFPVTRQLDDKTNPGNSGFVGIFGNNAIFCIPTVGPYTGQPFCFGIGPMECEITGPTFTEDGKTLIAAIQHPGELHGTRGKQNVNQPTEERRRMLLTDPEGQTFAQIRTVPLGSNFPSGQRGEVPRCCVVVIRRIKK